MALVKLAWASAESSSKSVEKASLKQLSWVRRGTSEDRKCPFSCRLPRRWCQEPAHRLPGLLPPFPGVSEHIPLHPAFLLQRPQPFPLAGPWETALCPQVLLFSLHGVGCSAVCRGGGRTGGSQA